MLNVIATPIGNLADISFRAIENLKKADFILAEDTRVIQKLLNHFEIKTKTISFHEHSNRSVYERVLSLLSEGKILALVSDAGTPAISDPGAKLVAEVRSKMPEVPIFSIPGPSALTAAISIAGLPTSEFYFAGFSPHKKGRDTFFRNIAEFLAASKNTHKQTNNQNRDKNEKQKEMLSSAKFVMSGAFIFYESPFRVIRALESLQKNCPDATITIVKEISKIHEMVKIGNATKLLEFFKANEDKLKGEFVFIVY